MSTHPVLMDLNKTDTKQWRGWSGGSGSLLATTLIIDNLSKR